MVHVNGRIDLGDLGNLAFSYSEERGKPMGAEPMADVARLGRRWGGVICCSPTKGLFSGTFRLPYLLGLTSRHSETFSPVGMSAIQI